MARKRAIRLAVVAAAGALLAAPLQADDGASVDELDRRVDRLENIVDGGQIADLIQRIGELERELRELRGEIETQAHRMDELRKRQRNLYADLDRRIRELEVAGTQGGGTGQDGGAGADGDGGSADAGAGSTSGGAAGDGGQATQGGDTAGDGQQQADGQQTQGGDQGEGQQQAGEGDPETARKAYDAAFELLKGGQYGQSASAFAEFVEQYPDSPYADNAQYWLGESRYVTREFEAALEAFREVVETYPDSAKVPDARLKIGYTLYELGRMDAAREALRTVMDEHANSAVARLAEERLLKIKRETQQSGQ